MADDFNFILDSITWSYSSVSCYENCPRNFKLQYIDGEKSEGSAFTEYGTFVHSLLADYSIGKYELMDLAELYKKGYRTAVKKKFPFDNLASAYRKDGKEFFESFGGFPESYEILIVEKRFYTDINGRPFTGIIDLLVNDKTDNKLIIIDHKSRKGFKTEEEKAKYLKQLYLYSFHVKEQYGEYPKKLIFNLVRGNIQSETDFSIEDFNKAVEWFTETVNAIYADKEYLPQKQEFFCNYLCNFRYMDCE